MKVRADIRAILIIQARTLLAALCRDLGVGVGIGPYQVEPEIVQTQRH
jgi:hypothetical protein